MKVIIKSKSIAKYLLIFFIIIAAAMAGFFTSHYFGDRSISLITPFVSSGNSFSYPLLQYSIENLESYPFSPSEVVLEELIAKEDSYDTYLFSYITLGKKMTGQINIPDRLTASPTQKRPAIVLIRGYVPKEIYKTGIGTKNAANALANQGYITVAPDFFGYGDSDPEGDDTWKTRFEKPIVIIELIRSLETYGITQDIDQTGKLRITDIGIWAHSNGGQIALTTLEALKKPIPTTLWAPVTAPFPYSVLYFGDELEDEGKSQRKWISMFEDEYDVFDFSLTKHLDKLTGPIQIHHGDADDAALIYWSSEFSDKIDIENKRREESISITTESTDEAQLLVESEELPPIDLTYFKYPETNHNMIPSWDKVMQRDIQFFGEYLEQ